MVRMLLPSLVFLEVRKRGKGDMELGRRLGMGLRLELGRRNPDN